MDNFVTGLSVLANKAKLDLSPEQINSLAQHWQLVKQANNSFNITAITDDQIAAEKHYLDCLLAVDQILAIAPKQAVDIGSGGGFPGIVLAIACPDTQWLLLEASAKKAAFLQQVIEELAINNATVLNDRAETAAHCPDLRAAFDLVTARAVSQLNILVEYALPLLKINGSFLAYKGPNINEEIADATKALELLGGKVAEITEKTLPDSADTRCLVRIVAATACPDKYPRRPGMPEKRPLS